MLIEQVLNKVLHDLKYDGIPRDTYDAICLLIDDPAIVRRLDSVTARYPENHFGYPHGEIHKLYVPRQLDALLGFLLNG